MKGREVVNVDLSGIPKGAAIYRAVFRPGRSEPEAFQPRIVPIKVTLADGDSPLPLRSPRYRAFDVTESVRAAVTSGRRTVSYRVRTLPAYISILNRLDVTGAFGARNEIPRVRGLRVRHRTGQTLLTWTQPEPGIDEVDLGVKAWKVARDLLGQARKKTRYRIYRSDEPITAGTIGKAVWVDEVGPLTCWNIDYYGASPRPDRPALRYVVEEGGSPVPPGTGIYAHNPARAGKAYYAVSVAVNGEEDLSVFDAGNATRKPVAETVGPGVPVLQRVVKPDSFHYVDGPELRYYVRWEAAPRCNLPSQPFDYLVALPSKRKDPAPVGLHLHCWGGSLNAGYGWWYNARQGAILISTNQIPYDWWTGYHEHTGTWKSWNEGVVRDYTQTRVMAFLDWAMTRWKIDPNRVFTAGNSMGGSGSPSLAFRRADRIAWAVSWVGVHTPARTPQFRGSYERVYGKLAWKLKMDNGSPAFEWFDDAAFVRSDPARETPLICFSNGKNDGAIGWPQARDFWKALQETRRPHLFVWGQAGHGQRARLPGSVPGDRELELDVRADRTLPAFTNCNLDGDPGGGDPTQGDPEGQSNLYLYWDVEAVDRADEWAMTLRLARGARRDACTVDVTPRRCRSFRLKAGTRVRWTNEAGGSGKVTADRWGLVTVPAVRVPKRGSRLRLTVTR